MARQSHYRYSPAVVNSPLALVAPTLMMNPQDPEAGEIGYVGEDEDYAELMSAARRIHHGWHTDAESASEGYVGRVGPVRRRQRRISAGKPVARPVAHARRAVRRHRPGPRYLPAPPAPQLIVVRRAPPPMAPFVALEDLDAEADYAEGLVYIGNVLDEIHDDEFERNY